MSQRITSREKSAILSSLGAGVVPAIGLHHIQVGRRDEVEAIVNDLKRIEDDGASVRFIVGRFGAGKSFFVNLMQTVALERRFVVMRADITTQRRLHGSGGQARALFSELSRNLATRSRPEGGALPNLVSKWVGDVAHDVRQAGGSDDDVEARLNESCQPLVELVSGYDFATVVGRYFRGYVTQDDGLQSAALRWLRAEYRTKTEARNDLGVRSIIDDAGFYDAIKLFAAFVRIAGYSGLLVCFDELVVLSHRLNSKVGRNNNYEAILRIVNDCLQGAVQGLGVLFAATADCMNDARRGLFSYEALRSRLAPNRFATDGLVDLSGPVVELEPLTPEDCYVLLHNIRKVHAGGDPEKLAVPDQAIEAYLENCRRRLGAASFQTPRETVKDFVGLLAVLDQNPDADWQDLLGSLATDTVETRDPSEIAGDHPDDDLTSFKL